MGGQSATGMQHQHGATFAETLYGGALGRSFQSSPGQGSAASTSAVPVETPQATRSSREPSARRVNPPAELSTRTLDPPDTAVSVEPEGLEADLDPYRPLVAATTATIVCSKFFLNSFLSEKGLAIAKHWPSKSECFHFQAPVRLYTLNLARGSTSEG